MANEGEQNPQPVHEDPRAHFAWMRTPLATERTLEAWVRTAISLIGFGFTIVQFFERINQMTNVAPSARNPHLVRYLGLILIGVGTLALMLATWQYFQVVRYLNCVEFEGISGIEGVRRPHYSLVVAILLCLVGVVAFAAILLRV